MYGVLEIAVFCPGINNYPLKKSGYFVAYTNDLFLTGMEKEAVRYRITARSMKTKLY